MNKVINGILFTKMYIVFDDDISPQLEKFTDFAIKLETIDTFYDITGINEMIQNKVKLITDTNMEYDIDMSFKEFKEIFMKFKEEKKTELFKTSDIQNKN